MNEQRYGRESATAGSEVDERSARPVDDISVVPGRDDVMPQRTIAPPMAPKSSRPTIPSGADVRAAVPPAPSVDVPAGGRRHLRAVERSSESGRADRYPVGTAVETVGAAVGWTAGYVKSRRPSEMRSDAERLVVASPALALVAALGFGFLIGSYMRR